MTKQDLIERFEEIRADPDGDEERVHGQMDDAMLEYINDPKVTELFEADVKWYA